MKENEKDSPCHGKKPNQKMKPYLVLQYLMQETDQDHPIKIDDITEYLTKKSDTSQGKTPK